MGCDIHGFAEIKKEGKWIRMDGDIFGYEGEYTSIPFHWRSYAVFGFLADVRNYSHSESISECKGLPHDSEYLNSVSPYAYDRNPMNGEDIPESERDTIRKNLLEGDYHSYSWLTLKELLKFNYDEDLWDRRVSKQIAPNAWSDSQLAEEGEGEITTYREHLGSLFFSDLEVLKTLGDPEDVRIIFWFDS